MAVEARAQHLVVVGGLGQQVGPLVGQVLLEPLAGGPQFGNGAFDVLALLLEVDDLFTEFLQRMGVLGHRLVVLAVELEDLADFLQGQAHALAAQDQDQPGAVLVGIDPVHPIAGGGQQTLVFIKAQRARRGFKLGAELTDGESTLRTTQFGWHVFLPCHHFSLLLIRICPLRKRQQSQLRDVYPRL